MRVIRYWHDSKETISHDYGSVDIHGDFKHNGAFGTTTIYKGNHFASKNEAIDDLIAEIQADIDVLENRKHRLLTQKDKP